MSRNSAGQFTLPLPPVVPGDVIESQWANATTSDLAEGLTQSLDRSGRGAMLAPLILSSDPISQPLQAVSKEYVDGFLAYATGMPMGAITAYAANNVPPGWLLCDGQAVSRTTYSDLYAAIGTIYGAGDNSTTFNVPDLRNEFIRGLGGAGVLGTHYPDSLEEHRHLVSITTGTESVGHSHNFTTGVESRGHSHNVNDPGHRHDFSVASGTGGGLNAGGAVTPGGTLLTANAATGITLQDQNLTHTHSGITDGVTAAHTHLVNGNSENTGGAETAPMHMVMHYIIKAVEDAASGGGGNVIPATQVSFTQVGAGAVVRTAQSKMAESVSVKDFGAVGDGVANDTAAIQAAINYCTTTNVTGYAFSLHVPAGEYKLTAALNIPSSYGFSIMGDGRETSKLIQYTNGETILYMDMAGFGSGHRSFEIYGIDFRYATPQTAAMNSKAIDCVGYNWAINHCGFANCYRGLYNLIDGTGRNGAWGVNYSNLYFNNSSGAFICYEYLGTGINGMPNVSISNVYGTGLGATEAALILTNLTGFEIHNFEANSWPRALVSMQGCTGVIGTIRLENAAGTYIDPANVMPYGMFNLSDSKITIGHIEFAMEVSGTSNLYIFRGSGLNSRVKVEGITLGSNGPTMSPSGATIQVVASTLADITYSPYFAPAKPVYIGLYDNGGSADFELVSCFPAVGLHHAVGDASYAVTWASEQFIDYSATLTANRDVTLPNVFAERDINGGQEFTITRSAATPGAFTLNLKDHTGTVLASIGPNLVGYIKFRINRFSWIITGKYTGTTF